MITIPVSCKTDKSYSVFIENGLLDRTGEIISGVTNAKNAVIVTDTNVEKLYLASVSQSLKASGFTVSSYAFKAGEPSKTLDTVSDILDFFCHSALTRTDIVIALGGGVTGDLTGFASSVYLRGVDFVQIPTTLLAQIDSSVGGKTGCDLPSGKNLCGAFHNPIAVLIDPETLSTLPEHFFSDGMAEAVKYGCIKSQDLFMRLETENPKDFLHELIQTCVSMKRDLVENDFTEKGERMLLNFGHTLGHAIERYQNFSGLSHGEAVGIGMVMITKAAEKAGLSKTGLSKRIADCLIKYELPTEFDIDGKTLSRLCLNDKKRHGGTLHLILLKDIGDSFVYRLASDNLEKFLLGETI